jgi:prepilin-type N-terminal cleavage/methylation domain-containing protein
MRRVSGFTLVELLVATAIALLLTAGLLAVAGPSSAGSKGRAAALDLQQRLRAAGEALGAELAAAGTGPVSGVSGRPFGTVAASLLPFRVGPGGDPDGTVRSDALTVLASPGAPAAALLAAPWTPGGGPAEIAVAPGCPAADPACGLRADATVLLIDGRGQADLFRLVSAAGSFVTLATLGATSGRAFPGGSFVVPVTVNVLYLKPGPAGEAGQLMSGDGGGSDMPLVDHVVALSFGLLGEPRPPALLAGPGLPRASYGPSPPPLPDDDPRDAWPAGENCTFLQTGATQASRLAPLHAPPGLVPLPAAWLGDGPWCPDAVSPGRYDADLLRVRAVRVTLRLEASAREARGSDPRLFAHPGDSRDLSAPAADRELVFDVVPRALQLGR